MTPAGNPSGPQVTSKRNSSRRVSWARAPSAAIARFCSMGYSLIFQLSPKWVGCLRPSMDNMQNIESSEAACAGSDTSHQSKQPKNRQGERRTDTADGDNACQECAECLIGRLGLGLEHRIQGIDKERSDACRDTKG